MTWLNALSGVPRAALALWGIAGFCAVLLAFNMSGLSAEKARDAHAALLAAGPKTAFDRPSPALIAGAIAEAEDPAAALEHFIAAARAGGKDAQRQLGAAARLAVRLTEARGDLDTAIAMSEVWIGAAPLLSQEAFAAGGVMTASTGEAAARFADTKLSVAAHALPERKVLILYLSNVALIAVLVLAAGVALLRRRNGAA